MEAFRQMGGELSLDQVHNVHVGREAGGMGSEGDRDPGDLGWVWRRGGAGYASCIGAEGSVR